MYDDIVILNVRITACCDDTVSDLKELYCIFFSTIVIFLLAVIYRTDNLLSLTTVPATISTVIFQSDDSSPKDVTESWHANDCFTSYGNNITQSVNCQFSGDVIESSDFLCFNAVKSVSYHIVHDQSLSSAVTNVSVELVITNVAQSLAPYDLVQDFSISFANMPSSTAVSEENGNQVTR